MRVVREVDETIVVPKNMMTVIPDAHQETREAESSEIGTIPGENGLAIVITGGRVVGVLSEMIVTAIVIGIGKGLVRGKGTATFTVDERARLPRGETASSDLVHGGLRKQLSTIERRKLPRLAGGRLHSGFREFFVNIYWGWIHFLW